MKVSLLSGEGVAEYPDRVLCGFNQRMSKVVKKGKLVEAEGERNFHCRAGSEGQLNKSFKAHGRSRIEVR